MAKKVTIGLHFIDSDGTPVIARTPWRLQLEEPNMDLLK